MYPAAHVQTCHATMLFSIVFVGRPFLHTLSLKRVPEKSSRVRARSFSARARGRSLKDDGPRKTCRFWLQGPPAQGSRSLGGSRAPPHGGRRRSRCQGSRRRSLRQGRRRFARGSSKKPRKWGSSGPRRHPWSPSGPPRRVSFVVVNTNLYNNQYNEYLKRIK